MLGAINVSKLHLVFLLAFFILVAGCSGKSNMVTLANGRQALKAKGKMSSISFDKSMLVLKVGKGEEMLFSFTDSTVKMNFGSMGEIRKGKPLEVVYLPNHITNTAVSIKKLQEAKCN